MDPLHHQIIGQAAAALAESLPDGVLIVGADGRIAFANGHLHALAGYERPELLGRQVETLIPDRFRVAHAQHRSAFAAEPRTRHMGSGLEIFLRRRDGAEIPADVALRPTEIDGTAYVVAAVRDASDRKALELALRDNEERLRLLVESVTDYALFELDPQGRVISWNEGAERIKGYRREEIVGEHFSVFYANEDVEAGVPRDVLAAAVRDGRVEQDGWRLRKDGTRFWANVVITAIRDDDGALRGFAKITRDMSARRLLEEEGRRLQLVGERERIGRRLHEDIVQKLFALGLALQAATFEDDASLRHRIDEAVKDVDDIIVHVRKQVFDLRSE